MPRVRIQSHTQGLFTGPAPSSGFHFVDAHGSPTGNVHSQNLLKQINGVQSINYDLSLQRTDVSELGRREFVSRPIINNPTVSLKFEYLTSDIKNEIRLGFNPNFHTGHSYTKPLYPNNTSVFLFSGFTSRGTYPAYSGITIGNNEANHSPWPRADRDRRNFYLTVAPEGMDAKDIPDAQFRDLDVISFGSCYIKSFGTTFAIGAPIRNNVSYVCDNLNYHLSGSGIVPAMTSSGFIPEDSGNIFVAPKLKGEISGAATRKYASQIAKTSDLTFTIQAIGYGSNPVDIKDVGIDFSNIKTQSVDFSVAFNRHEYIGLGYKIPIDRPIKYPIVIDASVSILVGEHQAGTLKSLLDKDYTYDFTVEARAPNISCSGSNATEVVARYDILKAYLIDVNFTNDLNTSKMVNLSFSTDVAADVTGRGLFLSGKVFETGVPFSGYNF